MMGKQSIPATDFFFVPDSGTDELEDLRAVLKLPAGRRVFRRLLSVGNVLGVSMGKDGHSTEYNEGLRALGLWLAGKIDAAAPGDFSRLILESSDDRQAEIGRRMQNIRRDSDE